MSEHGDTTVVRHVDAIHVYENEDGDVVIWQDDPMEEPQAIIVPMDYARKVITAIANIALEDV